ncbi:MAG: hypothetical protein SCG79_05735 [Nitrosomonadaceae bacterium]|nr:hypothetical protein [Nitrosomonadaceae bacterium]
MSSIVPSRVVPSRDSIVPSRERGATDGAGIGRFADTGLLHPYQVKSGLRDLFSPAGSAISVKVRWDAFRRLPISALSISSCSERQQAPPV